MIKDQEFLKSKASFCLDLAKKMGATDASVTVGHTISETVNFRNKNLEASDRSDGLALSIEIYIDKKRSSITSSNLIDENISLDGKKVTWVPVSFALPITFNGDLAFPLLNSIKYFFPSLLISNFNFSDNALTTETPTPCKPPDTL